MMESAVSPMEISHFEHFFFTRFEWHTTYFHRERHGDGSYEANGNGNFIGKHFVLLTLHSTAAAHLIIHRKIVSAVAIPTERIVIVRWRSIVLIGVLEIIVSTRPRIASLPLRSVVLMGSIARTVATATALSCYRLRIVHDRCSSFSIRWFEHFDVTVRRSSIEKEKIAQ